MWKTPRSRQNALTAASAASGYTAPVGLFGETVTTARVRGGIATPMASTGGWYARCALCVIHGPVRILRRAGAHGAGPRRDRRRDGIHVELVLEIGAHTDRR